jgi:diguanylate cyclase (GGDEF)-like protein
MTTPNQPSPGRKVLIVDDEDGLRRVLSLQLKRAGYEICEAPTALAAWEMLQTDTIQIVITDWMMPEMNGLELVQRIRAADFPLYTYVIMLTALGTRDNIVTGLTSGADDYLTKPFDSEELKARLMIAERILALEARLHASIHEHAEMALRDGLTGLLNRRAFDVRLNEEVRRASRYNRPLALLMLDIDYFKHYNDSHGHPQGDRLLCELAQLLTQNVRVSDTVARYGGEEFAIILPETIKTKAMMVGEKIRAAVAEHPFPLAETQPGGALTLSLGVAAFPEDLPESNVLLDRADQALYRAKHTGRNRVVMLS